MSAARFPLSEKLTRCAPDEDEFRNRVETRRGGARKEAWNAVGYADALIARHVKNFGRDFIMFSGNFPQCSIVACWVISRARHRNRQLNWKYRGNFLLENWFPLCLCLHFPADQCNCSLTLTLSSSLSSRRRSIMRLGRLLRPILSLP